MKHFKTAWGVVGVLGLSQIVCWGCQPGNTKSSYLRGSRYGSAPHHWYVLAAGHAQGSYTGESLSFAPCLLGSFEVLLTSMPAHQRCVGPSSHPSDPPSLHHCILAPSGQMHTSISGWRFDLETDEVLRGRHCAGLDR